MVAFLGGLVVLLFFLLVGALATIERKNHRIAELEAVRARESTPAKSTAWHVVVCHDDDGRDSLFDLWPIGDDRPDEPTKVS